MSIMVGMGRGAQSGVLIKNAEALERMEKVDTLVVDKTGTLTEGKPSVVAIRISGSVDETTCCRLAASLERSSEHPLAGRHRQSAEDKGLAAVKASKSFDSPVGKGVLGVVDAAALIGNVALMKDAGIDTEAPSTEADEMRRDGPPRCYVAVDGRWQALVAIADPIKAHRPPRRFAFCRTQACASSC